MSSAMVFRTPRQLRAGDVVSFDVSVYLNGVFGALGDRLCRRRRYNRRGGARARSSRRRGARRGGRCVGPGRASPEVGPARATGRRPVRVQHSRAHRGHGIGDQFHMLPLVQHFRNRDRLELTPGMIFTIEPMLTEGSHSSRTWSARPGWTVLTTDGGGLPSRSAAHITEHGPTC